MSSVNIESIFERIQQPTIVHIDGKPVKVAALSCAQTRAVRQAVRDLHPPTPPGPPSAGNAGAGGSGGSGGIGSEEARRRAIDEDTEACFAVLGVALAAGQINDSHIRACLAHDVRAWIKQAGRCLTEHQVILLANAALRGQREPVFESAEDLAQYIGTGAQAGNSSGHSDAAPAEDGPCPTSTA